MKYGMNMLLWATEVTPAHDPLLADIKEWGYDGVEIPVFEMTLKNYKRLGKQLDSLGLERTAVTVSTGDANPISPQASVRKAALSRLKKVVDICAAMEATKLCGPFHSALGEFTGKGRTDEEWKRGQDVLAKLADHAEKRGVTLVLEYLNRFECYFLNSAEDCSRFTREVNHKHLKMMYDTFHANIEEKDIKKAIKTCADQMVHVHISENDRSTPGEGGVDWNTSFAGLRDVKYDGWFVVEAFGLALPDLAAATKIWRRMFPSEEYLVTKALKFMKTRWEKKKK
ncbi:MAG: sugar phosphate isomerase/epimerase [Planctomycetota bacterium]|nr:sugar phosphate isomerase/epimerase [Planctomycetota bacterium]MDA1211000.1 sugar phosphate isomerase/epimerase [Planctomycetota bacterium]